MRTKKAALQALAAALLFGGSAPLSKLLLGSIGAVPLAGFLYLGSGLGLLLFFCARCFLSAETGKEAGIARSDIKWLTGAILCGGILAPILLMVSLKASPASTASLLLNFESVSTAVIAVFVFKEQAGKRIWLAVAATTLGSILLSFDATGGWGITPGAAGVLLACALWGADNNFTRCISAKDPLVTVIVKGLAAGSFSLLLAALTGISLPAFKTAAIALLVGFFCYGLSILLYVYALRGLGASRASALFGVSPFAGTLLSIPVLRETPPPLFYFALPLMLLGAFLLLGERHHHFHTHPALVHEHMHRHDDGHHFHSHESGEPLEHSHVHVHEELTHSHPHTPDIHHRHTHEKNRG